MVIPDDVIEVLKNLRKLPDSEIEEFSIGSILNSDKKDDVFIIAKDKDAIIRSLSVAIKYKANQLQNSLNNPLFEQRFIINLTCVISLLSETIQKVLNTEALKISEDSIMLI